MSNGLEIHELAAFDDAAFDAWHHVYEVANLRLLRRERPDIVRLTTYYAEVIAHMIGVNEAMGFVPVARLGDCEKKLGQLASLAWPSSRERRRPRMADSSRSQPSRSGRTSTVARMSGETRKMSGEMG